MKHGISHFCLALAVLLAFAIVGLFLPGTRAQETNRVGLVVRFGDGSHVTRCVEFSEPEISGYDALMNSGLDVVAAGWAICDIEGESGCPVEDCFCQCHGIPCTYWTYWHLVDGNWDYSGVGAGVYKVHGGDVEGWSWGAGEPPPVVPFDQICVSFSIYLPVALRR